MNLSSIVEKAAIFNAPALPDIKPLVAAKDRVMSRWPEVDAKPPEKDRERLVQEVRRRWETPDWDHTPMSLVTTAAWALFDEERRERFDLSGLRQFYYDEIKASMRTSFLDRMWPVYLQSYQPGAEHTRELAEALKIAQSRLGAQGQRLLQNIPDLLDPTDAPAAVAARMRDMDNCWNGLKTIGMLAPHAPGLMDHAHLAFLNLMQPVLKNRNALEKLFKWLKPDGRQARTSGASEAITAVLDPWLHESPLPEDMTYITETLLGLYGHPRKGGNAWGGVPTKPHLELIMRWLTGENIRFFIDVISVVEKSHMFYPRREFWLSLHEQKRIDSAWVAFSDAGVIYATQQLRARGNAGALAFGRQTAGGGRKDTSLLIMKIGSKTVVEGSHNYKVHIFNAKNPNAPDLYRDQYDCDDLRQKSDKERVHDVPGHWRNWVLEQI